ncbi:type II CAAX prenyl endopeptidase Rce1 family protein [Pseudarthrobacter sulfonivorans]|uniref:CPBP family intramembrane glutamic endopeptidase n=1 Tax=Pseudarthrobacter sulfonivorans TaxID=121292 RepID=UPI0028639A4B|nr:CPBP family glutamic-type intramembrane protease [Pseudarthrobacter sulfonivorans]MDR6414095.1 membrane protease YdiL (CAAX protease family) [Pseudarthrobacter sulfonivorans]
MSTPTVRPPFRSLLPLNLGTGILLLIIFGLVRVALVLQANVTGSYQAVGVVFVAMIALPWVLLTREGRKHVGMVRPTRRRWVLPAGLAGVAMALGVHSAATTLWGHSLSHPFAYIALSYSSVPVSPSEDDRLIYFIIFAVIGMLFSPIGEEVLYRGVAHESFAAQLGDRRAALIDAAAFAVTHLAHFGVVYVAGVWAFLPLPALFWVAAMFVASLVFYGFRKLIGSLLGAVAAHAGFNLAMNWVIFYAIVPQ